MRAEAEPFYREGGEAVGMLLSYEPELEDRIWRLVSGLGLWKRWYLAAFKSIWQKENPRQYACFKSARYRRRRRGADVARRLEASREAALAAMPTKKEPSTRNRNKT